MPLKACGECSSSAARKARAACGLGVAAPHQHLGERVAHAELGAQRRDGLGRAGGDLEADARHAGEVTAGRDGTGARALARRG